ncbi:MAG: DNA polymerase III subunit alpha, partial [Chloroflexi bacterium]|nr:DNA polymerase III subunit alpha [Chloroflexota bacterium]
RLISAGQLACPEQGRRAGQKGQPRLTLETLAAHAAGLICLSGCRRGPVAAALLARDEARARQAAGRLRDIFSPDCFFIEVQRHYLPTDARLVAGLVDLARELGLAVVATNDVHHADRAGQRLHDLLTAVRHHATLPEALAAGLLHPNSERYLKSPAEMAVLFADLPAALRNTIAIAERCQVSLDFAAQRLPAFPVPPGHTPDSYLSSLCHAALPGRCQPVTAPAQAQLAHELAVIAGTGLAGYFLVVWDIVRLARERGIRCQGRGSAANSLVAYLLGITPVDPLRHHLLFERFLSAGARTMPDIDVDFAADRREEVIQYVYERYGEAHVGMVCNVVTYRARSALRDVAKALAFPPDVAGHEVRRQRPARSAGRGEVADVVDRAAQALETRAPAAAAASLASASSEDVHLPWAVLAEVLCEMEGVPRHLSIHVGGLLVTAAPLLEVVPLERATMPGRVVVQWDKDSVEDAGLIKIDLLGLRTLGMVEEALSYIRERGSALDLDRLPLDDPAVYALLQRADTVGCFQVESRAQAQMLPRLQPQCFADLVVAVALVRPGPIQGNMVHPYLRRRQGLEPVEYLHPALEPALAETLGVILFQEQVIRVALAVAGFAPAEADALRRALGRESAAELAALRARFLTGAQAQGLDEAAAAAIYQQLTAFAGYGFCKSHAAAFALLAYQTLYLKAHFPAEFTCALLNHQPLGFYSPAVLVGDAGRHGVPVRGPDANRSQAVCTLEGSGPRRAVRLGPWYVHGLGEVWPARIVERRGEAPFRDLRDLCRRTRLPRPLVENLVRAGALDGLGRARRDLVWELGALDYQEEDLDLAVPVVPAALPALSDAERLGWEYDL